MTLALLPDTRTAVILALQASTDLDASITVVREVQDNLPDLIAATGPYVAVYRPPGPASAWWGRTDRAMLNIQVWDDDYDTCGDTARDVYAVVHSLGGSTYGGAFIASVGEDVTGLGELPDPGLPSLFRNVFTVPVTATRSLT